VFCFKKQRLGYHSTKFDAFITSQTLVAKVNISKNYIATVAKKAISHGGFMSHFDLSAKLYLCAKICAFITKFSISLTKMSNVLSLIFALDF